MTRDKNDDFANEMDVPANDSRSAKQIRGDLIGPVDRLRNATRNFGGVGGRTNDR